MSELLALEPYGPRNEQLFLQEMIELSLHHLNGSSFYKRIWPGWSDADSVYDLPYVHVGLFKYLDLKTMGDSIRHERTLHSSSTSGIASKIILDKKSAELQSLSSSKILSDFLGNQKRPLCILDSVKSLRCRGSVTARVAAAMSLKFLASRMYFLLADAEDPESINEGELAAIFEQNEEVIVYGFSWMLWLAWGCQEFSQGLRQAMAGKTIHFVHSGGWKKLENLKVSREQFDEALLAGLSKKSKVIDYYGLVEQVGIVYPLCEYGFRHVPVWADVIVRDSYTMEPLYDSEGQLQLLNTLAVGAPYHSVLTEDLGKVVSGACPCGRSGKRFEMVGRIPKAELRGCANV